MLVIELFGRRCNLVFESYLAHALMVCITRVCDPKQEQLTGGQEAEGGDCLQNNSALSSKEKKQITFKKGK